MIRTWTGPEACRNVPQVVETGKNRAVTAKVRSESRRTGRMARPRACHGSASRPMSEMGSPISSRTLNRLWPKPSTRSSSRRAGSDGQVARQGRRIVPGEDVEAVDAERVGHRLTGQRAAEDDPVTEHPRGEDQGRHGARADDEAHLPGAPPDDGPHQPEPDRLVAGQRGEADEDAQGDHAPVEDAARSRVAGDPAHQEARAEGEDGERHRRVGEGAVQEQREIERGGQARPDREGPGARHGQSAFLGDVRGEPPGEDGHEGADHDRRDLGGGERGAEDRHRDGVEEGGQREPDLEGRTREDERRRPVAPQGVGDEAPALEEVARDADVVGGVLGLRKDDRRRDERPCGERHGEDGRAGQPRLLAGHGAAAAVTVQRVSSAPRQTG